MATVIKKSKRNDRPSYIKQRIAKVKEVQETIQSLCDNESSSTEDALPLRRLDIFVDSENSDCKSEKSRDIVPKSKKRKVSKSFNDETANKLQNKTKYVSSSSSGETDIDYSRMSRFKNHRGSKEDKNTKKGKDKNRDAECSDSESEGREKSVRKKERKRTTSKSIEQNFVSLHKEEADSSSGKEFQKKKFSRGGSLAVKKLSEKIVSDSSSSKRSTDKTAISKEQSFRFKSRMAKIMNKFKEVCSEYELLMEHMQWKHIKKDLKYEESASKIVHKSKDVINKLRMELESQEEYLGNFYHEWRKNCTSKNSDHEDSSLSEREASHKLRSKEKSDKSENESIVSEYDNGEIFSENDKEFRKREDKKDKKEKLSKHTEKSKKSDSEDSENILSVKDGVNSPILGCGRGKEMSDEVSDKILDSSVEMVDENKKSDEVRHKRKTLETVSIVNDTTDSAQDIFDETIDTSADSREANKDKSEEQSPVESEKVDHSKIIPESDSNTDKNLLETGESGAENNMNSGVEDNNKSGVEDNNKSGAEYKISGVEDKNSGAEDNKDSDTEENKDSGTNETEPASCQETSESTPDDHATVATDKDEEHEDEIVNELEELAKRAILESDSDSSVDEESSILLSKTNKNSDVSMKDNEKEKTVPQAEEKRVEIKKGEKNTAESNSLHVRSSLDEDDIAKVEVCAKRILLDSNSDDSINPSYSTKASSDKKRDSSDNSENVRARAALLDSSNSESSSSDSSKPKSSKTQKKEDDKDTLKDETVSKTDNSLLRRRSTRHTRTNKNHNVESDEKLRMSCRVVVERLSEEVLKKYPGALKKSKHYLECKKLKSLIDLEKLKRNQNNLSNSLRSSPSKKKNKAAKETEDSLLNHLQKVENGQIVEDAGGSNSDTDRTNGKAKAGVQTNDELMMEADRATKKILLNSSDSDVEDRKIASESNDSESEKSKSTSKDSSRKSSVKLEKDPTNKESNEDDWEKNKWRRNKLLTMKLSSDSDSEAAREKWQQKQKELSEKAEESETENSAVKDKATRRKRRFRRKILDSDSDVQLVNSDSNSDSSVILKDEKSSDTESSVGKQKKSRKRKTRKSSDTDSSLGEKKSKPKRKRIKKVASDSDDSDDQMTNSQGTPGKKGRKNIRKVMKDNKVADDTKQAAKEEEERLKRIAERQKIYNEMYEARLAGEEKVDKLVLDFDPETKEELVSVDENLVKRLKPHQAKGIKFMWDACFESLEMTKSSNGSGCIIAHCMGLGKTLQVIALTHTLLTHEETGVKTVMVVCPLSTVLNWLNEFGLWLKDVKHGDDIEIYTLTKYKKNLERKYQLESWQRTGGVLIIGYEMFRNLSGTNNKMRKNMKEAVLKYLVDPGPDVIVCDEGHLLKNEDTALNKCMTRIRTLRRIVLTGTPLQNNLIEYHCMVQFVKPSLLGTKKEFLNRFVNPITNGQFDDSTEGDVKLMKKRAYVLHKMLKGCVQRFDYSVLMPFLPPKQEYVIFVSLTEVQSNMYQFYLDNLARRLRSTSGSLFADFQSLQRIWTHPVVLRLNAEKVEKMNEKKFTSSDSEGSLKDFIDDDSEANSNSSKTTTEDDDDEVQAIEYNSTRSRRKNNNAEEEVIPKVEEKEEKKDEEWWLQFVQPEHFEDMRISAKLLLLFGILKECEQIGDKVLVFSQSLYSLTLIEQFLEKIDNETQSGTNSELIDGHSGSWLLGSDYFRLDGQTPAENRNTWCKIFNRPSNTRARLFLISTRAGGLGINLTAANRVIIFDASWNPSHDVQSIFRIYRFGQKKPCYVYRFLASGTMEEKIYNRQVTKLSLSCRVVDEQQIERHYSNNDLTELYKFEPSTNPGEKPTLNLPKDRLLAEIFLKYKDFVENYHEHDSLLENKAEEELNEEERKQAWLEYEEEKKGKPPMSSYQAISIYPNSMIMNNVNLPASMNFAMDYEKLQELIRKDYPNATPECQQMMTARVLQDMYSYWEQQSYHSTSANQLLNQNTAMKQAQMRPQVSNVVQIPRVVQRPNTNISGQAKDVLPFTFTNADPKTTDGDDDIVEVPATPVASKNKNQEE